MLSAFVVVELTTVVVELPFALRCSLAHSSLTLELVGLLVGSYFVALVGSEHYDCYSRRS